MEEKIVDTLLKFFIKENKTLTEIEIPVEYEEKRLMLRGIINMRPPFYLSSNIISLYDKLLQMELKKKKIMNSEKIKPLKEIICIWKGDITELKVEAIVNPANTTLQGCFIPVHDCLDNKIHSAAGIRLRNECYNLKDDDADICDTEITGGYNLPCNFIIHTVVPMVEKDVTEQNKKDLIKCYQNIFDLALQNNIKEIAIPCIGTGMFNFKERVAAKIAIDTTFDYINKHKDAFDKIILNVYTEENEDLYLEYLNEK